MASFPCITKFFFSLFIVFISCHFPLLSLAQSKVVVLGSSTAAGVGASGYINSWVGKYTSYILSLNPNSSVVNLAEGGFRTTSVMPTGTNSGEDTTRNITKALSYNPNVIIVNLPSNDAAAGFTLSFTMSNLRTLRTVAQNAGVAFWITTSQPRNLGTLGQQLLTETRDSILAQFGSFVIDFWTLVANSDGSINSLYNAGDGIHVNDAAHEIFFQRVKAKPLLGPIGVLPISIKSFHALPVSSGVQLNWEVSSIGVEKLIHEIEKSEDGVSFNLAGTLSSTRGEAFSFFDTNPFKGVNYYRLKLITATSVKHSNILRVSQEKSKAVITVSPNPLIGSMLSIQTSQDEEEESFITVFNSSGAEVYHHRLKLKKGQTTNSLQLPSNLAEGTYYLKIASRQTIRQCTFLIHR
ncbi:MAG TPA: GDSL-type esterase/lipase family protein [Flavisolibacter sp.]|nr:GDSL-type esterase/lipase family protein [Flavisolibacter sp.]